jgi:hypothetical protein
MRRYISDQSGFAVTEWISAIAAILALVFAGLTYYMAYVKSPKPFDPSTSTGTPMLRETAGVITIVLSVPITNKGDDTGCISDIGLTLLSKTSRTQWSYFPAWQINMERYLKAMASKEDPFIAIEAPVSPVKVPGKSTNERVFLFMPRPSSIPQLEPLRVKDLKPGETYVLSVFFAQGDANCGILNTSKYQKFPDTEFVLDQSHITELQAGHAVLPLDTARDALRKQFVGGP